MSEISVTKILSEKEILKGNTTNCVYSFDTKYNLGGFLENVKKMPSKYDERFVFIK